MAEDDDDDDDARGASLSSWPAAAAAAEKDDEEEDAAAAAAEDEDDDEEEEDESSIKSPAELLPAVRRRTIATPRCDAEPTELPKSSMSSTTRLWLAGTTGFA